VIRLRIQLEDDLVAELDARAGPRRGSAFVAELIRRALDDERRRDDIEASLGTIDDTGHEWDEDGGARGPGKTQGSADCSKADAAPLSGGPRSNGRAADAATSMAGARPFTEPTRWPVGS
jgi:hypothetical protein